MAGYLVLARKYRSTTFEEVVGQQHVAQTLVNALKSGRVAHAYLFTGTRGVGKTTMARILAKALNCLSYDEPTATPCNECDACEAIGRGDDLDVVEIDGASNRGIDEIRELRANAIYRPARSRYKIYYIDEVHQITRDAFNALLKTLEEPPEHVKFIFSTTESDKVPQTILSRCQRFDFRNIPTRQIAEHLRELCSAEGVEADDAALFRVARAAAGSMRDGLSLLDQLLSAGERVTEQDVIRILGTPPDEQVLDLARAVTAGDPAGALTQLDGLLQGGVNLDSVVSSLCEALRNVMVACTCGADSELIELPDAQKQTVAELAGQQSVPALVQAVSVMETTGRNIRGSSVGRALVEAALVRLAAAEKFVDPSSLVERLEALSNGQPVGRQVPRGPKKKVVASDRPARRGGEPSSQPAPAAEGPAASAGQAQSPDERWLTENWRDLLQDLMNNGKAQVVGAIAPAHVLAFDGETLRLGFEPIHENLRNRCERQMRDPVEAALGEALNRTIGCEFVPMGGGSGGESSQPTSRPGTSLSTVERGEIANDPAIQKVIDLFSGKLEDIARDAPKPPPAIFQPDQMDDDAAAAAQLDAEEELDEDDQ